MERSWVREEDGEATLSSRTVFVSIHSTPCPRKSSPFRASAIASEHFPYNVSNLSRLRGIEAGIDRNQKGSGCTRLRASIWESGLDGSVCSQMESESCFVLCGRSCRVVRRVWRRDVHPKSTETRIDHRRLVIRVFRERGSFSKSCLLWRRRCGNNGFWRTSTIPLPKFRYNDHAVSISLKQYESTVRIRIIATIAITRSSPRQCGELGSRNIFFAIWADDTAYSLQIRQCKRKSEQCGFYLPICS